MAAHYRAARAGGGEKVARSWAGGSGTSLKLKYAA